MCGPDCLICDNVPSNAVADAFPCLWKDPLPVAMSATLILGAVYAMCACDEAVCIYPVAV